MGSGEFCEYVFVRGSSVHQKCSNYALTNLLFGLCKFVWVIDLLVTLPNPHPKTLACPSTLKVLWTMECTPIPDFFIMFTLDSHLSLLRSVSFYMPNIKVDHYNWLLIIVWLIPLDIPPLKCLANYWGRKSWCCHALFMGANITNKHIMSKDNMEPTYKGQRYTKHSTWNIHFLVWSFSGI